MKTNKSDLFLVDASLRDKCADKIDTLSLVKPISLIPNILVLPTKQVAEYYEVDSSNITSCYHSHIKEFRAGEVYKFKAKDAYEKRIKPMRKINENSYEYIISDSQSILVPSGNILYFTASAILRIGMLLAKSEVANRIRSSLMNTIQIDYNTGLANTKCTNVIKYGDVLKYSDKKHGVMCVIISDNDIMFCANDLFRLFGISCDSWISRKVDSECLMETVKLYSCTKRMLESESAYMIIKICYNLHKSELIKWIISEVLVSINSFENGKNADVINRITDDLDALLFELDTDECVTRETGVYTNNMSADDVAFEYRHLLNSLLRRYGIHKKDYRYAWSEFNKELVYRHNINIGIRAENLCDNLDGGTRPASIDMLLDCELHNAILIAIRLCRSKGLAIDDLIVKIRRLDKLKIL